MKFFTVDWWQGVLSAEESDAVIAGYAAHLVAIRPRLPAGMERIAREVPLHDARLRSLDLDLKTATALLALELADGSRVQLRYTGLRSYASSADPEKGLSGPFGYGDLGYDELDVLPDGLVEHRILFSSGIHLALVFEDASFEVEQRET